MSPVPDNRSTSGSADSAVAAHHELVETLAIAHRTTAYLLEACSDEALAVVASKGWGLAAQFAHIHNVRLLWLDGAKIAHGLDKLATKGASHERAVLSGALDASASALENLVGELLRTGRRMPGFKPHTSAFVGYLIAHSGYHHGEIGIIAQRSGFPIDKKHSFGLWEWGVR
jgi:uncharacterized damage-inducible protein DinB